MDKATAARFQQLGSTPLVCLRGSPEDANEFGRHLESRGVAARLLRGSHMKTVGGLFGEFATELEFPSSFAGTWDAFEECLTDVPAQRPPAYVLVVTEAARLLADAPEAELETFLEIAQDAADTLGQQAATGESGPAVAFHVGFQERSESISGLVARLTSAGADPTYLALPAHAGS